MFLLSPIKSVLLVQESRIYAVAKSGLRMSEAFTVESLTKSK